MNNESPPDPAVSIIMPTYDRAAFVSEAVDHLLLLERPPGGVEIVVIDDGSHDRTPEILATYAEKADVRVIRRANGGPAAARNTGISASRGAILAFTDDDCRPARDWLLRLLAVLESSSVVGVGGRTVPASTDSLVPRFVAHRHISELPVSFDGVVRWVLTCNAAFRRHGLQRVGGFDESYPVPGGEDTDLCARLLAAGFDLGVAPDAVVKHDYGWRSVRRFAHTWYRYGQGDARHLRRDGQPLRPIEHLIADLRFLVTVYRHVRSDLGSGLAMRDVAAFAALDLVRRVSKTVGLLSAYPRVRV